MEAELKDRFCVDHDALKVYFPLPTVLKGSSFTYYWYSINCISMQLPVWIFRALPLHASILSRIYFIFFLTGMFDIYQRMLSLKFTRIPDVSKTCSLRYFTVSLFSKSPLPCFHLSRALSQSPELAAHVWHPDVALYSVADSRQGREGAPVGHFYLDLHPREGKFTHAAVFPLVTGCDAGSVVGNAAASDACESAC